MHMQMVQEFTFWFYLFLFLLNSIYKEGMFQLNTKIQLICKFKIKNLKDPRLQVIVNYLYLSLDIRK